MTASKSAVSKNPCLSLPTSDNPGMKGAEEICLFRIAILKAWPSNCVRRLMLALLYSSTRRLSMYFPTTSDVTSEPLRAPLRNVHERNYASPGGRFDPANSPQSERLNFNLSNGEFFNLRSKIHQIFGVLSAPSLYLSVELVRDFGVLGVWHASCRGIARKRAKFKTSRSQP